MNKPQLKPPPVNKVYGVIPNPLIKVPFTLVDYRAQASLRTFTLSDCCSNSHNQLMNEQALTQWLPLHAATIV